MEIITDHDGKVHDTTSGCDAEFGDDGLQVTVHRPVHADVQPLIGAPSRTVRLIVVVEGGYDIQFLKRISRILHDDDPRLPDLRALEQAGELVFIPCGGSNFTRWTHRLAGLRIPEFHLYDREISPLTGERQQAVDTVNLRPGCVAQLTAKRSLENYLHPLAIWEARGIRVTFGDSEDVPGLVAQQALERQGGPAWTGISARGRRRFRDQVKRWLNTQAVERMTVARLDERDPNGDMRLWLMTIARMIGPNGNFAGL
jgi:hypothetical protein